MNEFLQSGEWLRFQEAAGMMVVRFSQDGFLANGIMHKLPLVGKYLYVPRGPICNQQPTTNNQQQFNKNLLSLVEEARKQKARWIRIEPQTEEVLEECKKVFGKSIVKAPHDVQPREIFVMDIAPDIETLLAGMKPKTRYNINLAEKKGVKVFATREKRYQEAFPGLMTATASRKEITPHPRSYYENFFTAMPQNMCQLFVAEYEGHILAANLLMIFGTRATYLHGGSGDKHRDVMAPYLLQWRQIRYAKEQGCTEYDFGGVRTANHESGLMNQEKNSWEGITRFKMGFAPQTKPIVFPGAYDIILNHSKYALYNRLRLLKENFFLMKRFLKK